MRIRHPTLKNKETFDFLIWLNVNENIDFEPTQPVASYGFAIYLTPKVYIDSRYEFFLRQLIFLFHLNL